MRCLYPCIIFILFSFSSIHAQYDSHPLTRRDVRTIKLVYGDPNILLTFKNVNITYDYTGMTLGDFPNEASFLEDIRKEKGEKKAEDFTRNWYTWPKNLFEPRFEEIFTKKMRSYPITVVNYAKEGNIDLLVKVINIQPYSEFMTTRHIDVVCTFSDQQHNTLLRFNLSVDGSHEKYIDEGIAECFGFAGGMLAKEIRRIITRELKVETKQ